MCSQSTDNPVKLSAFFDNVARPGEVINIKILAEMDKEWHIYSIYKASEGPLPTEISVSGSAVGSVAPVREPKPLYLFDPAEICLSFLLMKLWVVGKSCKTKRKGYLNNDL